MKGKLCGLYDGGQQIGGMLDWTFELIMLNSSDGKAITYKFSKWKLTAPSYWLFAEPANLVVRLYHDIGPVYWEGAGEITSTTKTVFDTLIHEPLEIVGDCQLVEKT